jgi:hypothetical protein
MGLNLGPRKIQGISRSYFVNLAQVWTRSRGIEKGDKVTIKMLLPNGDSVTKNSIQRGRWHDLRASFDTSGFLRYKYYMTIFISFTFSAISTWLLFNIFPATPDAPNVITVFVGAFSIIKLCLKLFSN